ncbi:MAG: entericidin A/B family lipoprotein [Rhodospirillaceae bacterium]|nr:entericidin A/B family lipoprotein [Rhodospirillaceae bacterium]
MTADTIDKGFSFMIISSNSIKHIVGLLVSGAVIVIGLSACNTIEGAGQDIKSTGKAIERTADKNK